MGRKVSNHTSTGLMHGLSRRKYGRAISLLFAGLLTYLSVISAQTWLAQVEERIGALGGLFGEKSVRRESRWLLLMKKVWQRSVPGHGPGCNG